MKNSIILVLAMLGSFALMGQSVRIQAEGPLRICAGFGTENQVKINILDRKVPVTPLGSVFIAYIYYAENETTGMKMWFTNQTSRWVPIPFPGRYKIHAMVEYIMPDSSRPYMVSMTNTIIVEGMPCATELNP